MSEKRVTQRLDGEVAPRGKKPKKPYAKPAVVYRQPLEGMASVCTGAGGDACALLYS